MNTMKKIMMLGTALLLSLGLCACGKATMKVNDGGTTTEIEVSVPSTVEKILEDAEITLKDGDEVNPALDTKISEAQEIVISRKNTIHLTMDGKTEDVVIVGGTISDLLKQEGITLGEKQHINYDLSERLTDGMEVKIFYSFAIEVQCDGKTLTQETEATTVGDALAELKITLGEDDRVTPAVTEAVTDGMKIVVNRITFETVVETETLEYETTYENDSSLTKGEEQVSQNGENGEKEVSYKVTYVDGTEESREAIEEKVTKEPVNKVVAVGTKEPVQEAPPAPPAAPAAPERSVVSKKAFYDCNGSGHGYYEITYSDGSVEYEEF